MSTRADRFTATQKKPELFSDFLNSFVVNPFSNQIAKVTNENSISQSIRNLVLTNLGERLFQPLVGGNINRSLFEPLDSITADNLEFDIRNTIKNNETRANLLAVTVSPDEQNNQFIVNIVFSTINNPNAINLNVILKRVR